MDRPWVTVRSARYTAKFVRLEDNLVYMDRDVVRKVSFPETSTTANSEILFFMECGEVPFTFHHQEGPSTMRGNWGIYLPTYQIMHWQIAKGTMKVKAVIWDPGDLPPLADQPFLFRWEPPYVPKTFDAISDFVATVDRHYISCEFAPNALARKVKKKIEQSFHDGSSIGDISHSIGIPHAEISRYFKKNYRISPVKYRNTLRIIDSSMDLLYKGGPITTVMHKTGFQGKTQFYQHFKHVLGVPPSEHRI